MKVLFDAHMIGQRKTGLERYSANLIKELEKQDIVINLYRPKLNNGLFRILFGFNLALKSKKSDILHTTYLAPIVKTNLVVITVHDICFKFFPETFSPKLLFAFNLFFKRSLKTADAIICGSNTVKNQIAEYYEIDENKIHVTYYAPDENFKFLKNKTKVRKALKDKFKVTKDYFLVVGNIEKRKNPFPIIDSFVELTKKNDNLQLVFVGQNKMGELFNKKYGNLIQEGKLKLLGYIDEEGLNELYNGSTALIYNSLCEGFGLPIMEAMATKTAVICSNLEVFREITDGSAILYEGKEQLCKMMRRVLEDESFRKKCEDLGYTRSTHFTWEKTAEGTLEIYKRIFRKGI